MLAVVSSIRWSCIASSGVGESLLCSWTNNVVAYSDGSDVGISVQNSRLVIASFAWTSCIRQWLSLVRYALRGSSSLGWQTRNKRRMS